MIAAIVLAAGGSQRLGTPKQLLRIGEHTLVEHAVRLAAAVGPVFLVTGGSAEEVTALLAGEATCVHNAFWREGMSGSLRCGLAAARLAHADLHGIVVSTCDQPNVPEAHLLALVEGLQRREIAASAYDGIVGVPAAFAASMFAELLHAQGDRGAREVIRRDPARVLEVPCEHAAHDVDSALDVVRLGLRLA